MPMDKNTVVTVSNPDGSTKDHVIIDKGDGNFVSMTKEYYDAQQAAQNTLVTESAPTA
jgi:hypothetical protein